MRLIQTIFILLFCGGACTAQKSTYINTFKDKKYGLMVHYLYVMQNGNLPWNMNKVTSWDSCVNSFNTKKFADDVAKTGAGYVIFSLQQMDQHFCAPNATFEKLSGYKRGTATSNRDLINDVHTALKAKNIDLLLYVTGNGPIQDYEVMDKLTNKNFHNRVVNNAYQVDKNYVQTWSSILGEFSKRYKTKVKGWWVDGAYSFIGYTSSTLQILSNALKSGNKNAIVAFNPSPRDTVGFYSALDDFTAGEIYHINSLPKQRFLKNVQWHMLTFLGNDWGGNEVRFNKNEFAEYIAKCNEKGGVVTIDVCLYRNGSLDAKQIDVFKTLIETAKKR